MVVISKYTGKLENTEKKRRISVKTFGVGVCQCA